MSVEREEFAPSQSAEEPWYGPIIEFGTHVIVGTAIFLLIAGAAWILHLATDTFRQRAPILYYTLRAVEVLVFVADIGLYLIFFARTTRHAARNLLKGWNS